MYICTGDLRAKHAVEPVFARDEVKNNPKASLKWALNIDSSARSRGENGHSGHFDMKSAVMLKISLKST
jgi:hypothetical protein